MAWIDHSSEIFQSVPASSATYEDQIIPNGETWIVQHVSGAAAFSPDVRVLIVWDRGGANEEILFATHGDSTKEIDRELTGDGSKKLSIVLENDLAEAATIGGSYVAVERP